ncbi:MAG: phosphatidylserine decarboxylase [Candidatus Zixiibacteriota bacterium]
MARDGWLFVGPAILFALVAGVLSWMVWTPLWVFAAAGLLAAVCFAFFFRDPVRRIPEDPLALVAPADGRVVIVEQLPDNRSQIHIFLSVLNVHVNRSPAKGRVLESIHRPGEYHAAMKPEAGTSNERQDITLETAHGEVRFSQIAGVLARRIVCRLRPGDQIQMGERFGLIRFGSRMQVIAPPGFETVVNVGDKVRAGESIIARYNGSDD